MSVPSKDIHAAVPGASTFERDGYLVARGLASAGECDALEAAARQALEPLAAPVEFEVDVGYPGAPTARSAAGGDTPRRLLHAFARGELFQRWALGGRVARMLAELYGREDVLLSQSHHNCVMTKHPGFSSVTSWHRDQRYWCFERDELISAWLALGRETAANGALQVIPGSHRLDLPRGRFDDAQFLRADLASNEELIAQAQFVELDRGDVLFFHSRLLHAAGCNQTDTVKLSLVFTYHCSDNAAEVGSRSARYPSVPMKARTAQ